MVDVMFGLLLCLLFGLSLQANAKLAFHNGCITMNDDGQNAKIQVTQRCKSLQTEITVIGSDKPFVSLDVSPYGGVENRTKDLVTAIGFGDCKLRLMTTNETLVFAQVYEKANQNYSDLMILSFYQSGMNGIDLGAGIKEQGLKLLYAPIIMSFDRKGKAKLFECKPMTTQPSDKACMNQECTFKMNMTVVGDEDPSLELGIISGARIVKIDGKQVTKINTAPVTAATPTKQKQVTSVPAATPTKQKQVTSVPAATPTKQKQVTSVPAATSTKQKQVTQITAATPTKQKQVTPRPTIKPPASALRYPEDYIDMPMDETAGVVTERSSLLLLLLVAFMLV